MYQPFEDATFQWGQAGLPGTGITAGEKASINSRLTGIEADLVSEYYTQSEVDAMIPVPFNGANITRVSTTSISDYDYFTMATLTLPAGTYRIDSHAVAPFARSVADGAMQALIRIGTSESAPRGMDVGFAGYGQMNAYDFFTIGLFHSAVVTSDGSPITVDIGFRGMTTAGTTFARRPALWGTYQRIG